MTSRFTTQAGSSLHVEEHGIGMPVLAIHGLGGGSWFFAGLGRRMARAGHRLVAVDLPGTGRSREGRGELAFSMDTWVEDLGDFVSRTFEGPVVVLGHSMGTILALHAWTRWPERVRGLIFAGGLPEPRPLIRQRLADRAAAIRTEGLQDWGPRAAAANMAASTVERQPELAGLFARLFEAQDSNAYLRACEILLGASASPIVTTVTVPCLSITGSEDEYAPPDLVERFSRRLAGRHEIVVIPECGHLPFLEAPAAFAETVTSFVDTLC